MRREKLDIVEAGRYKSLAGVIEVERNPADIGFADTTNRFDFQFDAYQSYLESRGVDESQYEAPTILITALGRLSLASSAGYSHKGRVIVLGISPIDTLKEASMLKTANKLLKHESEHFIEASLGIFDASRAAYEEQQRQMSFIKYGGVGAVGASAVSIASSTAALATESQEFSIAGTAGFIAGAMGAAVFSKGIHGYTSTDHERSARAAEEHPEDFLTLR